MDRPGPADHPLGRTNPDLIDHLIAQAQAPWTRRGNWPTGLKPAGGAGHIPGCASPFRAQPAARVFDRAAILGRVESRIHCIGDAGPILFCLLNAARSTAN